MLLTKYRLSIVAKRFRILLLFFFLFFNKISVAQHFYGIGLDANVFKMTGISNEQIVPYGYSGANTSTKHQIQLNPNFYYGKKVNHKFVVLVGLGFTQYNQQIAIDFSDARINQQFNTELDMKLNYISNSYIIQYQVWKKNNFTLGVNGIIMPRILLSQSDNYQDIIWEEIYFFKRNWYNRLSLSAGLGISCKKKYANNTEIEFAITTKRDASSFIVNDTWGLYNNLSFARHNYIGLGVTIFSALKNKKK